MSRKLFIKYIVIILVSPLVMNIFGFFETYMMLAVDNLDNEMFNFLGERGMLRSIGSVVIAIAVFLFFYFDREKLKLNRTLLILLLLTVLISREIAICLALISSLTSDN